MSEAERGIEGWQDGDAAAAICVQAWLWEKISPIVSRKFQATDGFKIENVSADAQQTEEGDKNAKWTEHVARNADHFVDEGFWAALEELESMLKRLNPHKTLWIKWTNETKE